MNNKYRRSSALLTVLVMAIIIVLNVGAYVGVNKFNFKYDMTSNKMFEITEPTIGVVEKLKTPVEIIVINSENDFLNELKEIVKRYDALSDLITIRYVDPYLNPTFVEEYTKNGKQIALNSIIVKSSLREKIFEMMDMYILNPEQTQIQAFIAEQQITSAIQFVTNDEVPAVTFIQGHNEVVTSHLQTIFERNNFKVENATLTAQDITSDTEIVVIAAPARDFDKVEIKKLDEYMARGGNLIVMHYPAATKMPNLEGFMTEWGITLGDYAILDPKASYNSNPLNIIAAYYPHLINNYFADNKYFMLMPESRNLVLEKREGKTTSPVLITTSEAFGKTGTQFKTTKEAGDAEGPFILAATSTQSVLVDGEQKEAKMFVAGSKKMYYDDVIASTNFANGDFIAQVISWCSGGMEVVNIQPKDMSSNPLTISTGMAFLLSAFITILIPLIILIYGISVFLKRRHL